MELTSEFPHDPGLCYLNHAAVAPWPRRARDAVVRFADENLRQGARAYPHWIETEQALRRNLAALINAAGPEDIALVKNTSEALSMVAYGLAWEQDDEVVITDQEFPSNRIVWESLASRGVKTRVARLGGPNDPQPIAQRGLKDGSREPEAAIEAAVNERTRLVSISSVQYGTGLKLDLKRLGRFCRARNVLFCVDAIQSIGSHPVDVEDACIDFTMADGHKWLLGPEGLCLFYVRPTLRHQLALNEYGWHMVADRGNFDRKDWTPADDATRFECGSPNMLAAHALRASTELLLEVGMTEVAKAIEQAVDALHDELERVAGYQRITPDDPSRRAGILTFRLADRDNELIQKKLMGKGVICAYRGGGIRFSPHFYTTDAVIVQAVEHLRSTLD
ncbi:MAG: aminotransferase [Alteromonadaceae bacterium]|nr:aminotransferase [Alteromonadaceae bacterium]|tara:strand:- start:4902 stop:6077 length:1176 start_codon:yes stop_codon:yes gene_type:complete